MDLSGPAPENPEKPLLLQRFFYARNLWMLCCLKACPGLALKAHVGMPTCGLV